MDHIEEKLTETLYRKFCPDSFELGEYQLGVSSPERAAYIQNHLTECPHCTRELEQLRSFLKQLSPDIEYSLAERVKIWIARLLPDLPSGEPGLAPAFGLRGGSEKLLVYQAGEAQLSIEVQDDSDQAGRKSLLGLVIGIDPAGLQAHLWQSGEKLASVEVDELGNFVLPHLEAGDYELILSGPELEIHIQELVVK